MKFSSTRVDGTHLTFWGKLRYFPYILLLLVFCIGCIGFIALYSAAGGNFDPWAKAQMIRFIPLFLAMIVIALTPLKWWYWMAYPLWGLGVLLLLFVEVKGVVGMGAQRWISLGFMNLQPSELIKIAVIMALARYYHDIDLSTARRYRTLFWPMVIVAIPMGLVLIQPNLGTTLMIGMAAAAVLFIGGVRIRLFIMGIVSVAAIIPIAYHYLHPYQKRRVDTFLDPSSDPLGAGYNIIQSKIAIGSGGMTGKGYLAGTQSQLNFLPEKQTDFIFTLWAEEWGILGCLLILALYYASFVCGFMTAFLSRHMFGKLLTIGLTVNLSLYVLINTGMVMGLLPVVGIPLPMISYGGSAAMAALICYGLIMSAKIHKNQAFPRSIV